VLTSVCYESSGGQQLNEIEIKLIYDDNFQELVVVDGKGAAKGQETEREHSQFIMFVTYRHIKSTHRSSKPSIKSLYNLNFLLQRL